MKYTLGHIVKDDKGKAEQLGTRCYNAIPAKDDIVELEIDGKAEYFKVKYVLHASYTEENFDEDSEPDLVIEKVNSPY